MEPEPGPRGGYDNIRLVWNVESRPAGGNHGRVALFGAQNRDGWGVGLTILTALANLLSALPEEETFLALFHGARRVAANCDGEAPRTDWKSAGCGYAQALAAALDERAPSRGRRAYCAHGDRSRCRAGCARRYAARSRDRAGVR